MLSLPFFEKFVSSIAKRRRKRVLPLNNLLVLLKKHCFLPITLKNIAINLIMHILIKKLNIKLLIRNRTWPTPSYLNSPIIYLLTPITTIIYLKYTT